MPTIDTLVEDIYGVLDGRSIFSEEVIKEFGEGFSRHIHNRITQERSTRQDLRMSNLGTPCERKLWYSVSADHVGEALPPQARMKFLYGDILEELLFFLAAASGHTVSHRQHTVTINGVEGHIDGLIDGVLVDSKSASSFSFNKFARHELEGNDPFGYIDQLNGYHYALRQEGIGSPTQFAFLVIDKTLGHVCLDVHEPNGVNYEELVQRKRAMLSLPSPPKRTYMDEPDGKSGNRKLPTVCGFCDYKASCWSNLRTFLYASGPRYLTRVEREPDVPEVPTRSVRSSSEDA